MEYTARVHHDDDGWYWADVIELPGCFASGRSLDELREALEEAISMWLTDTTDGARIESMHETGVHRRPMQVDEMKVLV